MPGPDIYAVRQFQLLKEKHASVSPLAASATNISQLIDALTQKYIADSGRSVSYAVALRVVLDSDPELKTMYAAS